jgi:hypothetical protein
LDPIDDRCVSTAQEDSEHAFDIDENDDFIDQIKMAFGLLLMITTT